MEYLTGSQVVEILNIQDFELLALVKQGALNPMTKNGHKVRDFDEVAPLLDSDECRLYKMTEVLDGLWTDPRIGTHEVLGQSFGKAREKHSAEIARLEKMGIKPISPEKIFENAAQGVPCQFMPFSLPVDKAQAKEVMDEFREFLFSQTEVDQLKQVKTADNLAITNESGFAWSDITIKFLNDWEIHLQWPNGGVTRKYEDIGFEDKRDKTPIDAWKVLRSSSTHNNNIPHTYKTRSVIEKTAGVLRKKLKLLFPNIEGDPVPHNKGANAYDFLFKLKPPPD